LFSLFSLRTYPFRKTDAILPAQNPSCVVSENFYEYIKAWHFRFTHLFFMDKVLGKEKNKEYCNMTDSTDYYFFDGLWN
jgi:hypothetical protein